MSGTGRVFVTTVVVNEEQRYVHFWLSDGQFVPFGLAILDYPLDILLETILEDYRTGSFITYGSVFDPNYLRGHNMPLDYMQKETTLYSAGVTKARRAVLH